MFTEGTIIPAAQKVLGIQSNAMRLSILDTLTSADMVPFRQLRQGVQERLGGTIVSGSTLSHLTAELQDEDLVERTYRGALQLQPLGEIAMSAFREYRSTLLPQVVAERIAFVSNWYGPELAKQLQERLSTTPEVYRPEPILLRLMKIQSHPTRLGVLVLLSESSGQTLSFRELSAKTDEIANNQSGLAGSTLSNINTLLIQESLLTRQGDRLTLTPLGLGSVQAYFAYQEKLKQPLIDSLQQKIFEDFGLK